MFKFVNPLARREKQGNRQAIAWIEATTRARLKLPDDAVVSVIQLACCEAGCPDVETVVAILCPAQKPRAVRLYLPIAEVTEDALIAALSALDRDCM
jgi:hypothetical protein